QNGRPLYELAREGIEVKREPKTCQLYEFKIQSYASPQAQFRVKCSSGTYIRTLAQDFAKDLGTLAYLKSLERTSSGVFSSKDAWTTDQIGQATQEGKKWEELRCWLPFDRLLDGYHRADATPQEARDLLLGRQN